MLRHRWKVVTPSCGRLWELCQSQDRYHYSPWQHINKPPTVTVEASIQSALALWWQHESLLCTSFRLSSHCIEASIHESEPDQGGKARCERRKPVVWPWVVFYTPPLSLTQNHLPNIIGALVSGLQILSVWWFAWNVFLGIRHLSSCSPFGSTVGEA